MSLTASDLSQIRSIGEETVQPVQNEIRALRNDIRDIYDSIEELRGVMIPNESFQKLSPKDQILKIDSDLQIVAKHIGIELPR